MAERPAEGLFGWTRLGCVTFLLTVLPIWLGLTGAFVYLWGDDWPARMGLEEAARFLGVPMVWWVALVQGLLMLALIAGLATLFLGAIRALAAYFTWRSHRAASKRYDDLVGDGAVLRSDAWATSEGPDDEPTEPGRAAPGQDAGPHGEAVPSDPGPDTEGDTP